MKIFNNMKNIYLLIFIVCSCSSKENKIYHVSYEIKDVKYSYSEFYITHKNNYHFSETTRTVIPAIDDKNESSEFYSGLVSQKDKNKAIEIIARYIERRLGQEIVNNASQDVGG
jgi:predicted 3-demethylubiquinone-9 3-methyltransferase (glyoxalase superfamily)